MSTDAYHMTAPHPEELGAKNVMLNALRDAKIKPEEIDYISHVPRLAVVAQSSAQLQHSSAARRRLGTPAKLLAANSPTDPGIEALATGPDGNIWFTECGNLAGATCKLGKISPTTGAITEFADVRYASGLVAGPDGLKAYVIVSDRRKRRPIIDKTDPWAARWTSELEAQISPLLRAEQEPALA